MPKEMSKKKEEQPNKKAVLPAESTAEAELLLKEEQKKKKIKLSIIAYTMGVCAVLLAVLFIADMKNSTALFKYICHFFYGLFSWAAWTTPILLLYSAFFVPQLAKKKTHIWNLILAATLCVSLSVVAGLLQISEMEKNLNIIQVFKQGIARTGGGIVGTYIAWLFKNLLSVVGAWILVGAVVLAQVIFLVGLTLDDAWVFLKRLSKKLWVLTKAGVLKLLKKKEDKDRAISDEEEDEESYDEEDDSTFIPPPAPKKGTVYRNKPIQEDNPYADEEIDTGEYGIAPIPAPEKAPFPNAPAPTGWGGETERPIERVRPKAKRASGSVDLDSIFNENSIEKKDAAKIRPIAPEEEEEQDDGIITSKKVTLITAEEHLGEASATVEYSFPPLTLLTSMPKRRGADIPLENDPTAHKLVDTLRSFKVRTHVVNVSRGPTITRYELQPEEGVRVKAIANLVDDISLNLATSGVRIEAPIPGKAAVGVEVPNKQRETVYLKTLLEDRQFEESASKLTAAIGVDVAGDPVFVDIAKMPHLMIAGTTGSGKSVCLNSLILSILYKATPDEVKMIMIDPKKVEFNVYNGLPHLMIPVVSDAKKAAGALTWAVSEMEERYEKIEAVGVRDIKNYNRVTANDPEKPYMPQLVIIIDELADLMMTAPGEVEESICRVAQKGRAAGVHLIIGTQRPSVDVITGLIKANIPSRVAFTVSSQVDSRTIIDIAGAEKLIGRGDMLFAPIGAMKPMRLQGPFVSDEEVEAVTDFIIHNSTETVYDDKIIKDIEKNASLCGNKGKRSGFASEEDASGGDTPADPMLHNAIDLAIESGKISTSLLQRRLSLGYGRAAKLIDEMERRGIVSPPEGQKPREVLISMTEWQEMQESSRENAEAEEDDVF